MPPLLGAEQMEFAGSKSDLLMAAAVVFRRKESKLVKEPGYEDKPLDAFPAMTWWWYEVTMEPVRLVLGEWDLKKKVVLRCRHYLATVPDTMWLGIITVDAKRRFYWHGDFAIRRNGVFEIRPTEKQVGKEDDLWQIAADYRKQHKLEPQPEPAPRPAGR